MGLYVETICSGYRNGLIRGDHMQRPYKWVYTWRSYAVDIEKALCVETICSGHKNGILRGDHMQWT